MTRRIRHIRDQIRETYRRVTQKRAGALYTLSYLWGRLVEMIGEESAPAEKTLYGYGETADVSFWLAIVTEIAIGSTELCELHCKLLGGRFVEDSMAGDEEIICLSSIRETAEAHSAYLQAIDPLTKIPKYENALAEINEGITALFKLASDIKRKMDEQPIENVAI